MRRLAMIAMLFGAAAPAVAQDAVLQTARDLYASAAYVEALAELARVESSAPAPSTARETDAYRTFCLVALGRDREAQATAESLVRRAPKFSIDRFPDASPRIVAMFDGVRRRVLPQVIRDEFRVARARAAEKTPDAESRLRDVRDLLDEADEVGVSDETLGDIRLIVDGFLELAHTAEPVAAPSTAVPAAAATSPLPAAIPSSSTDAGVVAPSAIFQPQPNVPPALLTLVRQLRRTSRIEIVINERGTVDGVTVTEPVSPAYDKLIVAAARTWRYKPALRDGVPIKFVSTVVINVGQE